MTCKFIRCEALLFIATLIFCCSVPCFSNGMNPNGALWLPEPPDSMHAVIIPPTLNEKTTKWQLSTDGKHALSIDDKIILWDVPLCRPIAVHPGKCANAVFSNYAPHIIYIKYANNWWQLIDIFSGKIRGFFKSDELPDANPNLPPDDFLKSVFSNHTSCFFSDMDIDRANGKIAMAGAYPIIWDIKKGVGSGIKGFYTDQWRKAIFNENMMIISPKYNFSNRLAPFWTIRCTYSQNGSLFVSLPADKVYVFDSYGNYSNCIECSGVITQLYNFGNHIVAERSYEQPVISLNGSNPFSLIRSRKGKALPLCFISNISDSGYFIGKHPQSDWFTIGRLRPDGSARWRSAETYGGNRNPKRLYMSDSGRKCTFTGDFDSDFLTHRIDYEDYENNKPYRLFLHTSGLSDQARHGGSFFSGSFISDSVWVGGSVSGNALIINDSNFTPDLINDLDIYNPMHQHYGAVVGVKSLDSNRFVTADTYGTARIWDSGTFELVATLAYFPKSHDYIIYTPDNYYKATKGATDMIHYVKGLDSYTFRQFDLRFNRPDIVLKRLGGDSLEIEIFHSAWLKRLRKLGFSPVGIDKTLAHAPQLDIINKNALSGSTANGSIELSVNASDSISTLRSLHVLVNDVPVYGTKGIPLNGGNSCSRSLNVNLAEGQNLITVYCLNNNGQESLRQQLSVVNSAEPKPKKLFVVAVGVSDYNDSDRNLKFAASDASSFSETLTSGNLNFAETKCLLLKNKDFSNRSLSEIRKFFRATSPDDVAVLYYAGHGILDSELNYYLGCSDTDFYRPESSAVKYDDFQDVIEDIPSLHRYCIVDACHSGDIDKDESVAVNTLSESEFGDLTFRSAGKRVLSTVNREVAKKYHAMFVDLSQKEGITVAASSSGDELSVESDSFGGGLFTRVLTDALSGKGDSNGDGHVSVSETFEYIKVKVPEISRRRQNPQIKYHNPDKEVVLK